ncbi:hypothetical protein P4571_15365 [Niallia alba]|uniref:hypothetical protein n=1 Tax=Niallia alba TaxID=2729105 RepID=UPI002E20723E|nr:hypothetical protein [Niallia alba]
MRKKERKIKELKEEYEELEENLDNWRIKAEYKLLYLKAVRELGKDIVLLINYINSHYEYRLFPLLAPKGYYHSGERIIEIKQMKEEYDYQGKNTYLDNSIRFLKNLKKDMENEISSEKDNILDKEVLKLTKKYILPIISSKIDELETTKADLFIS